MVSYVKTFFWRGADLQCYEELVSPKWLTRWSYPSALWCVVDDSADSWLSPYYVQAYCGRLLNCCGWRSCLPKDLRKETFIASVSFCRRLCAAPARTTTTWNSMRPAPKVTQAAIHGLSVAGCKLLTELWDGHICWSDIIDMVKAGQSNDHLCRPLVFRDSQNTYPNCK